MKNRASFQIIPPVERPKRLLIAAGVDHGLIAWRQVSYILTQLTPTMKGLGIVYQKYSEVKFLVQLKINVFIFSFLHLHYFHTVIYHTALQRVNKVILYVYINYFVNVDICNKH